MLFYRKLITVVAVLGLTASVFAADKVTNVAQNSNTSQVAIQTTHVAQEKVNINKATTKELEKVKGLNVSKARAIVAYRKKHGDFKSLDELKEVKGFKRMKEDVLKSIQDQLTIE